MWSSMAPSNAAGHTRPRGARQDRSRSPGLPAGIALHPLRQALLMREVGEAGDVCVELHIDSACRAMALLADDNLRLAVGALHLAHPFQVLVGAFARLR